MFSRALCRASASMSKKAVNVPFCGYKVSADELRAGHIVEHEGKKMAVVATRAAMMGRRPTSLHIDLRDSSSGKVYPIRFNPSDKVERIEIETIPYKFLYVDGEVAYAMHPETYEQIEFDFSILGNPRALYLDGESMIDIAFDGAAIYSIRTPEFSDQLVTETSIFDTNMNTQEYKNVTLANGRSVKVPQFVVEGDTVRIKVSDESFVTRL